MKEYGKKLEGIERKEFDVRHWHHLYEQARMYRSTTGWETAAEEALKIRKNDLPLRDIQGIPKWKGKFYKDNWLWKGVKWLVSMQTGAVPELDVKSYGGLVTPSQDLLEQELNYAHDAFDFTTVYEDALYDRYYPGMGVVRGIWDTRKSNAQYATGTPRVEYVDVMNVYLDPASRQRDKSDMRYMFHEDWVDLNELKRRYPKYKSKMREGVEDNNPYATNRGHVITMQYRKTIPVDKVFIEDRDSGSRAEFLLDEWNDWIAEQRKLPETQELYIQYQAEFRPSPTQDSPLSFEEWLSEGGSLPEKVAMVGAVTSHEDAVFQAIYMPEGNLVLEQPQYIGDRYTYFFLIGYHEPDSAYPFGLAHYMKDLLEVSIVLMTILTVQAVKTYKNEKEIAEESLVNQDQYEEHGYEIGVNPVVREEWKLRHPGERAVNPIPLPQFPRELMILNDQLINAQKTMTGAVDASIGLAQYSGQSGVQVAQLQTASRTYQREDIEAYRRFIKSCVEWLKDSIVEFRNYPHQIQGLDLNDQPGFIDVATDIRNKLDSTNYYVEVTIQESQEVIKQIEREVATNLFDRGLLSPIDYLREIDKPNPEKLVEAAEAYRGEREVLEILRQFPELQQMVAQYAQQAQQQPAPNQNQERGTTA